MSAADPAGESLTTTARRSSGSAPPARKPTTRLRQHLTSGIRKRTNSMGWAPDDCHTCIAKNRPCDRSRPRCEECIFRDDGKCGGYVLACQWQPGVASRGKMKGRQLEVDSCTFVPLIGNDDAKPTAFVFIQEQGQGERTPATGRKSRSKCKPAAADVPEETPTAGDQEKGKDSHAEPSPGHDQGEGAVVAPVYNHRSVWFARAVPRSMSSLYGVTYEDSELLSFYEWQFSRTTITCDVKVNPWQCSMPMVYTIDCLRHAVTAVSGRHRAHCLNNPEGDEVFSWQKKAFRAFSKAIPSTHVEPLIATSLAFIGLEYAETGFSHWTTHLRGALEILETKRGLDYANSCPMLRCQIAMLLWWDITAALLSMHVPVFPERYIKRVLSWSTEYPGEWSYMSLNGCPDVLLLAMHKLASSAPFAGQLSHQDISEIELYVSRIDLETGGKRTPSDNGNIRTNDQEASSNPNFHMSGSLYPSVSADRPLMAQASLPEPTDRSANLIKCWQLSMLLYIRQIFYRPTQYVEFATGEAQKQAERRRSLSRDIIGLISDMPAESNWQKQCLLPVVLAGFELRQQITQGVMDGCVVGSPSGTDYHTISLREWVTSYCARWKKLTGLWVFGTAGDLLRRLWGKMDSTPTGSTSPSMRYDAYVNGLLSMSVPQHEQRPTYKPEVWWGDLVAEDIRKSEEEAKRQRVNGHQLYPSGYLFG